MLITTFNAPANSIQKYAPAQKCNFSPSWTVVDKPLLSLGLLLFMKKIPLTQGQFALVDDEDYEYLMQWKWCAQRQGFHYVSAVTHTRKNGRQLQIKMHRVVLNLSDPKIICDHINCNPLDNRKSNLRICTYLENTRNRSMVTKSKSGAKGVSWSSTAKRYVARIKIPEKRLFLGYFNTVEEASAAYSKAAKEHFNEFANDGKTHQVPASQHHGQSPQPL